MAKTATKAKPEAKRKHPWDDSFIYKAYQYSAQGYEANQIGELLNVPPATWRGWLRDRPVLKAAIREAGPSGGKAELKGGTFQEFVYRRMPPHLRELLDRRKSFDKKSRELQWEELLEEQGVKVRQQLFLHMLIECLFSVPDAMRRMNVTKKVLDYWIRTDPEFAELVGDIQYYQKEFVAKALMKRIVAGDTTAIIFANRALNKDKGYDLKTVLQLGGSGDTSDRAEDIKQLETLDVETLRKMAYALEAKKKNEIVVKKVETNAGE